eukprot:758646-Hanusia_phi.AAC.3
MRNQITRSIESGKVQHYQDSLKSHNSNISITQVRGAHDGQASISYQRAGTKHHLASGDAVAHGDDMKMNRRIL